MLTNYQVKPTRQIVAQVFFCASLVLASPLASAQSAALQEVEIDRDATQLSDLLTGATNPNPEVAALLDTAMVLTSVSGAETTAYCYANDHQGITVGRVRVRIPAMGVRFFLASDVIADRGFVGSIICSAAGYVIGTELMIGILTTDIDVVQEYRSGQSSMLFPVTAMR